MYVDSITMREFRTFKKSSIDFVHPEKPISPESSRPGLANMNLVIGGNGCGKTTLLKGIALASLGPAVARSGLFPYHLIRRKAGLPAEAEAFIEADFTPNAQDEIPEWVSRVESRIRVDQRGDLEQLHWAHRDDKAWHPIFRESSNAFFFVGYGASRRVEKTERFDEAGRRASSFTRARRIMSLFEDTYSLRPLSHWLPRYPEHFSQVRTLVNRLLGPGRYRFTGEMEDGEYVFEHGTTRHGKTRVPFPALSDGYRAFLGWIGDLLYHVCMTCPPGKKLRENQGIVMIDEVDLHIHPEWQMQLLPRLAKHLPRLQFIVTSHSPLLVGSLEWRNVIVARQQKDGSSILEREEVDVSRMDADQILLTALFGLDSTRSGSQTRRIRTLLDEARTGDVEAARKVMLELSGAKS